MNKRIPWKHRIPMFRWNHAATLTVAVTVGFSASSCSNEGQSQTTAGRGGRSERDVVTSVAVSRAESRDIARQVSLAGPVEPIRVVEVTSRTAGSINSVLAIEGDRVRGGQLLAELDSRETEAQLGRAKALLSNAQTMFERTERMLESGIVTDAEFEARRATYETARSDVTLWETRLEFSHITAPTSGVITAKYVEAGGAVNNNQRLFDIADDSLLVIRVQMSELDVVHVTESDPVRIELDAYPGREYNGLVRRIFPSATAQTRLVPVEVTLRKTASAPEPRVGFLARVHFGLERRSGILVVPASAVSAGAGGEFVFIVEADTLVRQPITTGLTSGGLVEVSSGLVGGEKVVTSRQLNLQPGAVVRVVEESVDVDQTDSIGTSTGQR